MNEIKMCTSKMFEDIKHVDESGNEYWLARELQKTLEYKEWRKFSGVIDKAKNSCFNSNANLYDHFVDTDKMVEIGSGEKRKKLRYREEILDNMGSDELIINLFRISQTGQKLKNENIKIEKEANKAHYEVGSKIRKTIEELGGTMPEKLPTPKKSLKELEKDKFEKLERRK